MKGVLALAAVVAMIPLFGSACSGKRATRAEYARALNQVCADANAKIKALGSRNRINDADTLLTASRHGLIKANGAEIEDLYRRADADFERITPPANEKETAGQFVETSERLAKTLKQAFDLADANPNPLEFENADREVSYLETKAGGLARRLGADLCAPASG